MIDLDVAKKNLRNFALIHIIKAYLRTSTSTDKSIDKSIDIPSINTGKSTKYSSLRSKHKIHR